MVGRLIRPLGAVCLTLLVLPAAVTGQDTTAADDGAVGSPPAPSFPPGVSIAQGTLIWTLAEAYDNPDVPESSDQSITMDVRLAMWLDDSTGAWRDAGSRYSITGEEVRADRTTTDATGETCTTTGWRKVYQGSGPFDDPALENTEFAPQITFGVDPGFGGYLESWGSAATMATWTDVGERCDPPGTFDDDGRTLLAVWCEPSSERSYTMGTVAPDGASVDFACSAQVEEALSGSATISDAVSVSGVVTISSP